MPAFAVRLFSCSNAISDDDRRLAATLRAVFPSTHKLKPGKDPLETRNVNNDSGING